MTDPHLTVNGRRRSLTGASAHTNLLDALRGFGLTGAKEGCAEGECGACAVMVARPDGATSRWTAINSCLAPALALDGQEVVTAEGLGTSRALHPVQAELAARGGSQCGYCTPGFVCSMAAEFYRPDRTPRDGADTAPCIIAGPTCDSMDVLYEKQAYPLPVSLEIGDKLLIEGTGAYTATYSAVAFNGFPPLQTFHI